MTMPKRVMCVECGLIMTWNYTRMSDHANEPHDNWQGWISVTDEEVKV